MKETTCEFGQHNADLKCICTKSLQQHVIERVSKTLSLTLRLIAIRLSQPRAETNFALELDDRGSLHTHEPFATDLMLTAMPG